MISIITLNLWRYYDFEKRLKNIISVLRAKSPDIVFLQEVQIDQSVSPFSQIDLIKEQFPDYRYSIHSTIYLKDFQQGKKLDKPIQHGMAVLSKNPILNSFNFFVSKNPEEKEPRSILCFDVEIGSKLLKFANIHFANKEDWAKNQLVEFLDFINSRGEKRILAGDFNLFGLSKYDILQKYKLSYDYKAYLSYPKDVGCLDYVAIPEGFKFVDVELLEEYLSDHKALLVKLENEIN